MADILSDLRAVQSLRGDTYSSGEVLGIVSRAANEIERLRATLRRIDSLNDHPGHYNSEIQRVLEAALADSPA